MSKWVSYSNPCSKCGSSDGVAYDKEGGGFCFSCRSYIKQNDQQTTERKPKRMGGMWPIEEIERLPSPSTPIRGIRPEVFKKYGVKVAVSEATREPKHLFYPSGRGGGYKRKNLHDKTDMEIIGEYKGLVGMNKSKPGANYLIITEGEEDMLSAYQMLVDEGRDYAVNSLPNGAGLGGIDDRETYEHVSSFNTIMACFDNDEQGKIGTDKFADLFAAQVEIKIPQLPEGCNDANDVLTKRKSSDFLTACFKAKPYRPEKLEHGGDVPFEDIYKPIPSGVSVPQFPKLMKVLRGLRPEEMTCILAPPGVGKTSFCREVVHSLLRQGKSVANIFLEEKTTKTRQGIIAIDNDVPLWKFRENPNVIAKEAAQKSYDELIGSGRCHFVSHRGSLTDGTLLSLIRWYRQIEGVEFIVLDHASMVFSGRRSSNERIEMDGLLTDLAEVVEETGVHLIVVFHIKRMLNKIYIKDESNEAEWLYIDLDQARGTGAVEQLTWNLITLEPEHVESGERGRTRISVRKNREIGNIGPADVIKMDSTTGRMLALDHSLEY